MMKSVEELLRPRYKIIADFPGCSYEVGAVLYVDPSGELYSPVAGYSRTVTKVMQCDVDNYKANYQPLPWWSDRAVEDMPEYLLIISNPLLSNARIGEVVKVLKHFTSSVGLPNANGFQVLGNDYIGYYKTSIASLAAYEAYQQSKNK